MKSTARFDANTQKLMDMGNHNFYWDLQSIKESFSKLKTEKERVHYSREGFNKQMARFDSIPLWEEGAPDFNPAFERQNEPQMAFFPHAGKQPRGVVLISPGGGYNMKSTYEAFPVALRMVQAGYSAAVLDYRLKPYSPYISVKDIQRAIRVLRYRAAELNIEPDKIAVAGFSAGGNLSSMAAVHFDYGVEGALDPIDQVSCRPDAAIVGYGAFSQSSFPTKIPFLLYETPEQDEIDENALFELNMSGFQEVPFDDPQLKHKLYFSPEKHIRQNTPPFFLWQTNQQDDPRFVLNLAKELTDWGVPFELHCFPNGPHGLGLADGKGQPNPQMEHVMHWSQLAVEWLEDLQF